MRGAGQLCKFEGSKFRPANPKNASLGHFPPPQDRTALGRPPRGSQRADHLPGWTRSALTRFWTAAAALRVNAPMSTWLGLWPLLFDVWPRTAAFSIPFTEESVVGGGADGDPPRIEFVPTSGEPC